MQFLVVFHPKDSFQTDGPPADFAQTEQAEGIQAKALYKKEIIRQIWGLERKGKGAVGIFEVESKDKLQEAIDSFPMVQKNYVDYEIFPLGPFGAFAQ